MASLSTIYVKKETLKTLLETVEKKGEKGVEITVSINDAPNDYNQNVSAYVSQTKEQRESKAKRFYVGNGRTFWSKGETPVCQYKSDTESTQAGNDDLPF